MYVYVYIAFYKIFKIQCLLIIKFITVQLIKIILRQTASSWD